MKVVDEFYREFEKRLQIAEKEMKEVEIKDEPAGVDCEVCGSPMVYKMGRFGKFVACSNFPECRNTKPIVKEIGVKCPKCHEGNIVERSSKKSGFFTDATVSRNVISSHGISRLPADARNAKGC